MMEQVKRYGFKLSAVSELMGGHLEVVEYSGDGQPFVLAQDFDTMAQRLQEAERLLDSTVTEVGRTITPELRADIDAFLAGKP